MQQRGRQSQRRGGREGRCCTAGVDGREKAATRGKWGLEKENLEEEEWRPQRRPRGEVDIDAQSGVIGAVEERNKGRARKRT